VCQGPLDSVVFFWSSPNFMMVAHQLQNGSVRTNSAVENDGRPFQDVLAAALFYGSRTGLCAGRHFAGSVCALELRLYYSTF
jgi:hypothetical protein